MSETDAYHNARAYIDELLDGLRAQARQVADAHVAAAKERDEGLPWSERSELRLYVREQGGTTVYEWSRIKWYGKKGDRRMVRVYIPKPRGAYMYNLGRLLKYAKDWEAPMVEKTETQLARIRKQMAMLMKARMYLRLAHISMQAGDGSDGKGNMPTNT